MAAMVAAKKNPCNRSPFIHWFSVAPEPSQEELVGVYRWVLELQPQVSIDQFRCCLGCMQFTARHKLVAKFPTETKVMVPKWNDTLLQA
eukprot:7155709-Prorocentrum_lima.AAC.1